MFAGVRNYPVVLRYRPQRGTCSCATCFAPCGGANDSPVCVKRSPWDPHTGGSRDQTSTRIRRREMKKLKLDVETVEVQTFEVTPPDEKLLGTVHAEQLTRTGCGYTCRASCCHTDEIV